MKILVTGGTGFLGSRLLPKLVQAGHEVFALTRSPGSHLALRALGALPVDADLDSAKPLALPAIDAVVHAAAMFRFSGPREPYFRTNVDGTVTLLAASEKAGAKRFIFMSAAGIVMDEAGHPTNEVDESAPTFPNHFSAYLASKAQAEALVLAADKPALRTIALRPPAIWGPGDPFSNALPRAIKSRQFAFIDRGEYAFSTCHVDNVIEAIGLALKPGEGGRAFFIADQEQTTFRAFIASLATVQGLSVDKLHSIPYWVATMIGRVMDAAWSLTRQEGDPPISRSMMRMIGREFLIDDSAARRELGYVGQISRSEGLHGYVSQGAS
ncbi:nucleoside-diphosphate-sugar epimerase [Acetobacter nitrogenifigens DSM 23921 = NBRC 105050]|uniref:3-beta hydroxysteroid dehydrogenase n=1 Tax=Acetobacter nitrogenifigens DSM 23921 = NBRC 105050 TaxID=1120919 RepID=A0A511XFC6_9PROT|nr:NAD-dependent epimerase/dehydratase family protein [Acetobacter nitrogenifigens]GBQ99351.1 nucleoside-diphosphate-sugar epimerase [Acetobacter nitrogenifigens DSM 23921 = NBRC 105050]GEN61660.1 3-beta hydroxysteroid dehydrogenase [Acetobacter nitrogenifigens DSM 23921 = NBRC 105050]